MNNQRKDKTMKARRTSTRWLGLALACGTFTFALSTQAAKPPPNAAFVPVNLGQTATAINNAGQVVGSTTIPGYPETCKQACLLNPRDADGNGVPDTWFADQNADGKNDLIIALGTLPGSTRTWASAVNDLGLVVGLGDIGNTRRAFIVVPQAGSWYQDANGDGLNDLMVSLGTLAGATPGSTPRDLNLNNLGQVIGSFSPPWDGIGFLLNPVEVAPGVWQWFQDDGTGANALMQSLGSFAPRGINDRGQIVGTLANRATLRQPDGTLVDLGAGALPSWGVVINNAGQIGLTFGVVEPLERAGLLTPLDTNGDGAPDLWSRDLNGDGVNDLIVDIGAVQGLNASLIAVHGLNDAGSAVGFSWHATRRMNTKRPSFLWENGQMQTLSSLTGGVIEFQNASAINNARQILNDNYILLPTQ
jgi:uncharacterized membrane protein